MNDDIASPFRFPAVHRKKVAAAFDGGRLTSDGGVLLLAQAERAMGICRRLAGCIADRRSPARVIHRLDDILRARVFAIACGDEDADDLVREMRFAAPDRTSSDLQKLSSRTTRCWHC